MMAIISFLGEVRCSTNENVLGAEDGRHPLSDLFESEAKEDIALGFAMLLRPGGK
jgi:hypothetical protein